MFRLSRVAIGRTSLVPIMFVLSLALVACSSADSPDTASQATSVTAEPDSLDMMEIAFIDGYSRAEIKAQLDTAMRLYGMDITEENYGRAGSALVALRKEFGPSEMTILDHMIRSYVDGVEISFADAAGLSTVFLVAGDS